MDAVVRNMLVVSAIGLSLVGVSLSCEDGQEPNQAQTPTAIRAIVTAPASTPTTVVTSQTVPSSATAPILPTSTPLAPPPTPLPDIEVRLFKGCPPEFRDPCLTTMKQLLEGNRVSGAYGRIALCVNARGNWTVRAEKGSPPQDTLLPTAKIGDLCPNAGEHRVVDIFEP